MKKTILILSLFLTTFVYSNAFDDFMSNDVTKKSLSNLKEYASENDYKKVLKEVEKVRITYDKNVEYIENYHSSVERIQSNDNSIPKVLHFIWLGNKPYPTSSKTNLDRWIKLHPKFKIILWTDQNSVLEDKYQGLIEERDVEEFINLYKDDYPKLITLLKQSMNPGEKSDLIRYMILDKLGGVYIDHDIYPHKEISYLISEFSFICCCEPITPTVNKQYFRTSNAFIASKSNHKIIKNTIEIICNNWDHSTETMHSVNIYAYKDHSPVNNNILVLLRTYIPFTYAVLNTEIGDDDLILPPQYFTPDVYNDVHNFKTDFIAHESKGAWACRDLDSTNYSKITSSQLSKKINKISKKLTRSFNLILTLVFLFFILLSWLLIKRIIRK